MANSLRLEDIEDRIDCFGEFDRTDEVCLSQCGLNIECSVARERYFNLQVLDESLEAMGCAHTA